MHMRMSATGNSVGASEGGMVDINVNRRGATGGGGKARAARWARAVVPLAPTELPVSSPSSESISALDRGWKAVVVSGENLFVLVRVRHRVVRERVEGWIRHRVVYAVVRSIIIIVFLGKGGVKTCELLTTLHTGRVMASNADRLEDRGRVVAVRAAAIRGAVCDRKMLILSEELGMRARRRAFGARRNIRIGNSRRSVLWTVGVVMMKMRIRMMRMVMMCIRVSGLRRISSDGAVRLRMRSGRYGRLKRRYELIVTRQGRNVNGRRDFFGLARLVLAVRDEIAKGHLGRVLAEVGVGVHIDEIVRLISIIISDWRDKCRKL